MGTTLEHRPALDGLRGVAVVAVVAYHGGVLDGGWIGVDVFFVLSGYLITSLLLAEHESAGRIELASFWRRRARRLLPGLAVLLGFLAVLTVTVFEGVAMRDFRRGLVGALTYSSNWLAIGAGHDYWNSFAAPSPLEHVWSLAIEEQFYVLWPLAVAAAARWSGRRGVTALAGGGLAVSVGWALVLAAGDGDVNRLYLGTDSRAPALLAGALLASAVGAGALSARWQRTLLAGASLLAGAVLVAAAVGLDGAARATYRGPLLAVAAAGATCVLAASRRHPATVLRPLTWRPVRQLGLWSYGIYLLHWPVLLAFALRTDLGPRSRTLIAFAITVTLAAASYHFIEMPVRRNGLAAFRPHWLAPAGAGVAVVAAVLAVALAAPVARADAPAVATPVAVTMPPGAPRLLLVGDSVAMSLTSSLTQTGQQRGVEVVANTIMACTLDDEPTRFLDHGTEVAQPPQCAARVKAWPDQIAQFRPDAVLVMYAAVWHGWVVDGVARQPCDPAYDTNYGEKVDAALDVLSARGAEVFVVLPPPQRTATGPSDESTACLRLVFVDAVNRNPHAAVVGLDEFVCPQGECIEQLDGELLRYDGLHYQGRSALTVSNWLLDQVFPPG